MNDGQIIDLFWERSQDAIAETSAKYGSYCHSIAFGILHSRLDAEECVNDTWLRTWDAIPPERPQRLPAFLGRITRNLALDRYDYLHAEKRSAPTDDLFSELSECIPSGRDEFAGLELRMLLSQFLRGLEPKPRNLFLRRYWYCDSVEELSKRFGMGQSAVKSSLFRTRNKLRVFLEKEGGGLE